jgi:S-adenosylmethionine synthetase
VCEGHPDKVCDYIADSILDAYIERDSHCHVACEVLCKRNTVVLAGEITSNARLSHEEVVRRAIREIGYTDPREAFNADDVHVHILFSKQAAEINQGVDATKNVSREQGAGDQGMMFGYATNETEELMPLPILLAHRLARGLTEDRKKRQVPWLRPDGKTQVSVRYEGDSPKEVATVVVSAQHAENVKQAEIHEYVRTVLAPRMLGAWFRPGIAFKVNPTGSFIEGGPSADCGVTGRKIIVDTYGGFARHGGGAFSGKDPSKVDRSGAYFCRYVARQVVKSGLAQRAEIQVAYAIGEPEPVSVRVETFATGDASSAEAYVRHFDFRPEQIIKRLDLLRPIYRQTTNYGHFGKPGLTWESEGNS